MADDIEPAWTAYLAGFAQDRLDDLRTEFTLNEYVELADFGPPALRARFDAEAKALLEGFGQRRDLTVATTGDTRRRLEVVGRDRIAAGAPTIRATYHSPALRGFLAQVAKAEEISPIPYPPEEYVISRLTRVDDVHGWHWDDYPYALVWLVEAPADGEGGSLEFVRGTSWDKAEPRIEEHLRSGRIERRHPATGSAYLFRADTSMHRVAPLTVEGARRTIVCYSYGTPVDGDREVTHESVGFYAG